MSYQQGRIKDARNNIIRIEHPELPLYPQTNLTASYVAGVTSLTVLDNNGFSNADKIIVGMVGQDKTELATINGAVSVGTSISIVAMLFDHPVDTILQKALWNQVEISGASTVAGSKTVITTANIQFDSPDTEYVVTGTTYNYYFVRYYNSATATYSAYSDAAPAAGYSPDTVRSVKESALNLCGESIGTVITDDFLDTEITNCEIDLWKEKRRWAMFDVEDAILGTLSAGVCTFNMPSDISDPDTNESIRSVRVRQIGGLRCVQKEEYDGIRWDMAFTTLAVQANAGDTTLNLTSAADFETSGSVFLESDSITYTRVSTNQLTGIPASGTGSITATHLVGLNVWQGGQRDMAPTIYTVAEKQVNIVLPPSASYVGQAIYISYYSKPTYPDSDADLLNWPDPELYHMWLAWKIQMRLHNGDTTNASINFKALYDQRKQTLLNRARLQDSPRFQPRRPFGRQVISNVTNDDFVSWVIR